ncbi:MAG: type II secretion system GspH family protein [Gammaproteobacteria bacterium]|nr:type II secretion system GspH family protein [Gammaproteobacteria bacterium]MBU1416503.1 type II secretion system GspH family protein [Gammaproteobacteria bacterium]
MERRRGFTLVELVVVIMITGIMAASITVFFVPAINAYFDARRRAEMTDAADTVLRRMGRDVRRAVPNSIRTPNAQCFELVPTVAGGLYRRADDIVNAGADPLDTTTTDTAFDVLSTLAVAPVAGDFVVIGNQNGNDVYAGTNRGTVAAWTSPPAPGGAAVGVGRITLNPAAQFPSGYDGGRFQVVAAGEQSVFYICDGAGNLLRLVRPFTAAVPAACPAGGQVQATNVAGCTFVYNPNPSATQGAGFISMQILLTAGGETMSLNYGTHVSNVP